MRRVLRTMMLHRIRWNEFQAFSTFVSAGDRSKWRLNESKRFLYFYGELKFWENFVEVKKITLRLNNNNRGHVGWIRVAYFFFFFFRTWKLKFLEKSRYERAYYCTNEGKNGCTFSRNARFSGKNFLQKLHPVAIISRKTSRRLLNSNNFKFSSEQSLNNNSRAVISTQLPTPELPFP